MATVVLVRGSGDVAAAVAVRLRAAGYAIALHDEPTTAATPRGMAFADAPFDGRAEVAGVAAVRMDGPAEAAALLASGGAVPVAVGDLGALVEALRPTALVDARMRKRQTPEDQLALAPLVVGPGPGHVAGGTAHVAVETSWENLGAVIADGPTLPLRGEPRPIAGHARDRYVYAPAEGVFETDRRIGDAVAADEPVAWVGGVVVRAPLDGLLRGLTRHGVTVAAGTNVVDVDPRGDQGVVSGLGERPTRIADGVVRALRDHGTPPTA